jgi:hypothetical protein
MPRPRPDAAGREADGEVASQMLTAGVVDAYLVAEVDEYRHRRVRDYPKVDEVLRPIAESSHAEPCHPSRP